MLQFENRTDFTLTTPGMFGLGHSLIRTIAAHWRAWRWIEYDVLFAGLDISPPTSRPRETSLRCRLFFVRAAGKFVLDEV